jgi:A/G-specific adenine glycosylase
MLQQTQVKTVIPYYENFLRAFPTVAALNCASLSRVLRAWSGLGYYRRAENLKKSASALVRWHGGKIPQDYDKLRALPGIGEYTAAAILSIAFQERYPAIDGNARRVLGRLFNLTDAKELRFAAQQLVPKLKPGNLNQAVMELGATICLPSEPLCNLCPLAFGCRSHTANRAVRNVMARKKLSFTNVTWPLAIIRRNKKILLRRRAKSGLLPGMWELPGGEKPARAGALTALRRHLHEIGTISGRPRSIGEIRHSITHRRIRSPVFLVDVGAGEMIELPASSWRWVTPAALQNYPVSSMTHKAARLLASHEKSFS